MKKIDKQILDIAVPSIVSNITVPLLGLVDVAITGHLGAASYIGAIALGGMLFNIIYWIFAFLRMGTSGLTSQSLGRGDSDNIIRMLARSIAIAFAIAVTLLVLQVPLRELGLLIMQPTEEVRLLTVTYYNICIWGAPATLGLFALTGWFIGMQNSKIPMMIAITQNVVNILVSLVLVFGLGMRVEGVASGTLIAQWCGFLMGCFLCWRNYFGKNPIAKDIQPLRYYLSPSPITHQPSTINPQPSTLNHQPSTLPHHLQSLFPHQPRHFPSHVVHGVCHDVLHQCRLLARRGGAGREHIAHAAVSSRELYHGWLCQCWRGVERKVLWGRR